MPQGTTYKAPFTCDLVYQTEGMPEQRLSKRLGSLPVMLKSRACYLRNLPRRELVARKVRGMGVLGVRACACMDAFALAAAVRPRQACGCTHHANVALDAGRLPPPAGGVK